MINILPMNPDFNNNSGEEKVYRFLEKNLIDDNMAYYNYSIDDSQFDFCIIFPGKGILIVEEKSWLPTSEIKVIDKMNIEFINKGIRVISPEVQARNYAESLWEKCKEKLKFNIPIIPVVWFTNLDKVDFKNKSLDKVCNEEICLFKGDLENSALFKYTVDEIFENGRKNNKMEFPFFTTDRVIKFRNMFETEETLESLGKGVRYVDKNFYSILATLNNAYGQEVKDEVEKYLSNWMKGSKLYLITNNREVLDEIEERVRDFYIDEDLLERFPIKRAKDTLNSFNISCYYYEDPNLEKFTIIDGDNFNLKKYYEDLIKIDENSYFNLGQYEVEHSEAKNISVKAGAGTGKTHTMISRIMYLINKHNYTKEELARAIILITFTNEAADSMRSKLEDELINYYLLTKDLKYFQYIDSVINMNISTIDALVLKLLKSYGYMLGYGSELSVTKGVMEQRLKVDRELEIYMRKNNDGFLDDMDFNLYTLRQFIIELLKKIEERNIDILEEDIDLGQALMNNMYPLSELDTLIEEVGIESEKKLRETLKENNKIKLSQLVVVLSELLEILFEEKISNDFKIDYVFIDEFQDTDNKQIDMIFRLNEMIDFNLFIVGDIKQCIYRFRGAEENAFDRLIGNYDKYLWENYFLNKNYRTNSNLLNKYENIFERQGKAGDLIYETGRDSLLSGFYNEKPDPVQIISADKFESSFINSLKETYEKLNTEKDKGKIGILVRNNKEVESIMDLANQHIDELGFSIKNPNVGNLYNIDPTIDFYKLVLALMYNKNPKYLLNLYDTNYINSNVDYWDIYKLRENSIDGEENKEIYEYVMENWPIKDWKKYLKMLREDTTLMVLRKIIYDLKPWNNYGRMNHDELDTDKAKNYKDNLDLLFEKIIFGRDIDYLTLPKVEKFLRIMITTGVQEEARKGYYEKDVEVLCSTIHKAKGLEYDVVILPYTQTSLSEDKSYAKFILFGNRVGYKLSKSVSNDFHGQYGKDEKKDQIKEEIRILYVALTRAKDKLVIYEYDEGNERNWQSELEELYR